MTQPVFISYARDASREHAEALHKALGERTAFLDTQDIATGERFPEALVDALFGARVVVIFAEPKYFTRWYCLLEFRIARTPFLRAADRPGATAQEKADALRGLVIAMPPRGVDPMMDRFPPLVQGRNWPDVGDIGRIAALVEAELAANPPTLRERYAAVADADEARRYLLEAARLPPPRRIGNVPFVPQTGLPPTINDAFVGRADDLWRIHDLLWTERGDPATAAGLTGAIEATGGFGKTRLALEYLYRFGPAHFRGGLFWINAESDAELQLYDVLQALDPNASAIEVVRQGSAGVPGAVARAIRSRPDDAPTPLFIIDNVPEPQPDQPPKSLETWCPVLGEVPVLTTSRTRVALGAGGGVVALPIDTLDPASAVDLLTTATQRAPLTEAEWDEIAAWVGYLPLALEVLNRLLRSGEMTPRHVLNLSREQRPSAAVDAAMQSIRHVVPEGALCGITEAFSASYNLLTPEEQYAARLIAWMAPAPIPTFVIDAFGPEVFAPGVRAKLRNRSFVTEVRDASGAYFGAMHRVLADFIRAQSEPPEVDVEVVALVLARLLNSVENEGAEGAAILPQCAPLILSIFRHCIARLIPESSLSKAWELACQTGAQLLHWGHPTLAVELWTTLSSTAEQWRGNEHPQTLAAVSNLTLAQFYRGDYAGARALAERVLEAKRRTLRNEHPATLEAMSMLASILHSSGDYPEAEALQRRVLEQRRRNNGDEHMGTVAAMINLSSTLFARGDYADAQLLQERVLEMTQRNVGETHPNTAVVKNNLALTLYDLGEYAAAQELQQSAVELMRNHFGDDHPVTLTAMNNLATTLHAKGDYEGAQALQERALEGKQRAIGDDHPETWRAMSDLARTLRDCGEHGRAEELQERVFNEMRSRFGLEHPRTTIAAWELLHTYIAMQDSVSADRIIGDPITRENLVWLRERDPASLSKQQRQAQAEMRSYADQIDLD